MANVLISYFSEYGNHSYLAIEKELKKNGNNVFLVNWNNLILKKTEFGDFVLKDAERSIQEKIIDFNPELALNFNFSCPYSIIQKLNDCKIVIIDADNPYSYGNKKQLIEFSKNKNCYFWGLESSSLEKFERFLNKKIENNHFMFAPMATAMRKEIIPYKRNIMFLGSVWLRWADIPNEEMYSFVKYCYNQYKKNFVIDKNKLVKEFNKNNKFKHRIFTIEDADFLFWHFAGQDRLKYLSVLSDLGLEVYGNIWTRTTAAFDMEVSTRGVDGLVADKNYIASLYNSSKISVNFSCPQAPTGVSWRAFDIMASNSCLLIENKQDWMEYFAPYLTKETLNSVVYSNRYDMREKAIKLLNDEELRLRCVADLNNAIEQNGRWKHRLKKIEEFLGIKLLNNDNENGKSIIIIKESEIINSENKYEKEQNKKKKLLHNLKIKQRIKIIIYGCLIIIGQIPILDLIINKVLRKNLLEKIHKYWR